MIPNVTVPTPRSRYPQEPALPKRWVRMSVLAGLVAAACGSTQAAAETGLYVSGEVGAHMLPDARLNGGDTDRAARCDEFVNPLYAENPACTTPDRGVGAVDDWMSAFDGAAGISGGVAVGWRHERLRLELEWSGRSANIDQSSPILAPDGRAFTAIFGSELPVAEERIGRLRAQRLFVNGYWDFPNASRLTPFVGVGVGVADTRTAYRALWRRSADPTTVRTASGLSNEEEVKRNLAGTVSRAEDTLRDRSRGYQLLFGVEYDWKEGVSLALQARWTRIGAFEAGGVYDELRSHVSNLRRDGSEPVTYRVRSRDSSPFGFGLRLTRQF